jgi:hypothetical protein
MLAASVSTRDSSRAARLGPGGGVVEVEAAGAVEGIFGGAGGVSAWEDGQLWPALVGPGPQPLPQ